MTNLTAPSTSQSPIKTWEDRYDPQGFTRGAPRTIAAAMRDEIIDLRARLAAPSTSLTETQGEYVNQRLLDALEEARTGLLWYQDTHPESVDGSDTEVMERIDAAIETAYSINNDALEFHDTNNALVILTSAMEQLTNLAG